MLSHNHREQTLKFCKHHEESHCVRLLVSHHRRLLIGEFLGCWHEHADDAGCWQQAGLSGPWASSRDKWWVNICFVGPGKAPFSSYKSSQDHIHREVVWTAQTLKSKMNSRLRFVSAHMALKARFLSLSLLLDLEKIRKSSGANKGTRTKMKKGENLPDSPKWVMALSARHKWELPLQ